MPGLTLRRRRATMQGILYVAASDGVDIAASFDRSDLDSAR